MREDILMYLKNEIRRRCNSSGNAFGISVYNHICEMVNHAVFLAKRNRADVEVVAIAAWLYDVASITNFALYGERIVHSANIAKSILESLGYSAEKIKQVQTCILHQYSNPFEETHSVEEQCVSDADAISYFDCLPSLFYQVYFQKGYSIEEGTVYIRNMLEKNYHKLSSSSREFYESKYEKVMSVLQGTLKADPMPWKTGHFF